MTRKCFRSLPESSFSRASPSFLEVKESHGSEHLALRMPRSAATCRGSDVSRLNVIEHASDHIKVALNACRNTYIGTPWDSARKGARPCLLAPPCR